MSADNAILFKKKTKNSVANAKKRTLLTDDDTADTVVVKVKRERPANATSASSSSSSAVITSHAPIYEASQTVASVQSKDMGATWTNDVDGISAEEQALIDKALADHENNAEDDHKLYRGQAAYKAPSSSGSSIKMGPIRGTSNIRVTSRFDYAPDVCKDYKETGYCGYGDSCIFLHDRGDYKHGWQIDLEWDKQEKERRATELFRSTHPDEQQNTEAAQEDEKLPFACLICRDEFVYPVVTKCGHYFCEKCALAYFKKSPKCFACGAPTLGTFSVAKELISKLKERKKRLAEREDGVKEAVTLNK